MPALFSSQNAVPPLRGVIAIRSAQPPPSKSPSRKRALSKHIALP
ncbi:hypothetical protein [Candidatus Burkholderia verschuerenii]|nr:hypothetical protein [Candidatus Burkholderia verschuerenii]